MRVLLCVPALLALSGGDGKTPRFEEVALGLSARNLCGSVAKDYILEANGAGLAWLDFDGDGDLDLWITNGSTIEALRAGLPGAGNRLLRNDGGRFTEVSEAAGVNASRWGMGVAVGDYDGDGDPDVFVCEFGPNRLFRNRGDGAFEEVGERAGVADRRWASAAVFLDGDGDGDLDLYVANYLDFDFNRPKEPGGECQWKGMDVMCGPEGLPPQADVWFRNDDARFAEATAESGLAGVPASYGLGAVALDLEPDGDADLYVANDSMPNFLFVNEGDGRFRENGFLAGAALSREGREQAGMGIAVGDADGDGREDLLVTNFSGENNAFYRNLGRGLFAETSFPAGIGGPSVTALGWGAVFFDPDLDADLDLFVSNGHVYPQADGPGTDTAYAQRCLLFENDGKGKFAEAGASWGSALEKAAVHRAAATADFDDDGDADLCVLVLDGEPRLLRAEGGSGGFLALRLLGRRSNRDGFGARVALQAEGRTQVREARAGHSFQASNDPRVHFGLGRAHRVEWVEVRWPSGAVDRAEGLAPRTSWIVVEGAGFIAAASRERDG